MEIDFSKISELLTEKLTYWLEELVSILPNLALAAVILVLGFFIARVGKKFSLKFIQKVSNNRTLNNLFGSIIYLILIGVTLFTALSVLKLDKAVTTALAGAGILGLGLAFAFQDIAANFISGIFISFRKPLHLGDVVKIGDYMGEVIGINLRDTVISTFGGQTVIIPNKNVFQGPIENYSLLKKRRFDLAVGVSYAEDLERVRQITLDTVKDMEGLSTTLETTFFYESFGDSSIQFSLRMWIDTADEIQYKTVGSEAIIRIKKAYAKNDISIPFPIRTLDFGIKGGKTLSEMDIR